MKTIVAGTILLFPVFSNSITNYSYAQNQSMPTPLPIAPPKIPAPTPPPQLLGTLKVTTKVLGGNNVPSDFITTVLGNSPKPASFAELYNLAKELFHHPSKYADTIKNMRGRSELQCIPTNSAYLSGANPTNAKLITDVNPLLGIKLYNVETDNRMISQNAKPTSASQSSIVPDITTKPIAKESVDRPSIHKITRYNSDGKPVYQ
jgi:hypothetical protein